MTSVSLPDTGTDSVILKEGWIKKKSRWFGGFKKRWMILTASTVYTLRSKTGDKNTDATEKIELVKYAYCFITEKSQSTMKLTTHKTAKDSYEFVFQSFESDADLIDWCDRIQIALLELHYSPIELTMKERMAADAHSIGSTVLVYDKKCSRKWCPATIIKQHTANKHSITKPATNSKNTTKLWIKVSFIGYPSNWDEWVNKYGMRVKPIDEQKKKNSNNNNNNNKNSSTSASASKIAISSTSPKLKNIQPRGLSHSHSGAKQKQKQKQPQTKPIVVTAIPATASTIKVKLPLPPPMDSSIIVSVHNLDGTSFTLYISDVANDIYSVKSSIAGQEDIDWSGKYLLFKHRSLNDTYSVSDYSIKNKSALFISFGYFIRYKKQTCLVFAVPRDTILHIKQEIFKHKCNLMTKKRTNTDTDTPGAPGASAAVADDMGTDSKSEDGEGDGDEDDDAFMNIASQKLFFLDTHLKRNARSLNAYHIQSGDTLTLTVLKKKKKALKIAGGEESDAVSKFDLKIEDFLTMRGNDTAADVNNNNSNSSVFAAASLSLIDCPAFALASQMLKKHFSDIPASYFDITGDRCYCLKCHNKRGDAFIYNRGKTGDKKRYAIPIGWCRFGLMVDPSVIMNKVFQEWHVSFHGTSKETIPQIFAARLTLLKPGDIAYGGHQLSINPGHIKSSFQRTNRYTKKTETFNPNQIFTSPSIKYAANDIYAKSFATEINGKQRKLKFAFQCRQRPDSYTIGHETINAKQRGITIDEHFSNDELEWYTREYVSIIIHGLLIQVNE